MRDVLDAGVFVSLDEVRDGSEQWRYAYNTERSHEGLGRVPPTYPPPETKHRARTVLFPPVGVTGMSTGAVEPRVEFVRVTYDVESAAREVIDAGLPEEFAEFLRTGGASARS